MTKILIFIPKKLPKYIWTELGKEKLCIECNEYFPADTEFFNANGHKRKDGTPHLAAAGKCCYDKRYKRRKYKVEAAKMQKIERLI